jgi:hypothetical protein
MIQYPKSENLRGLGQLHLCARVCLNLLKVAEGVLYPGLSTPSARTTPDNFMIKINMKEKSGSRAFGVAVRAPFAVSAGEQDTSRAIHTS